MSAGARGAASDGAGWSGWLVVLLAGGVAGILLALSDSVQRLDWALDDRFVRAATADADPPADIVIVAIDEPSFADLQRPWPWPRRLHAALIDALLAGGARTIVFDIVFDAPAADPEDDRLLAEAIARAGRVVLATDRVETTDRAYAVSQWNDPVEPLARSARGLGAAAVQRDPDAVVRRFMVRDADRPGLALAAAQSANERMDPGPTDEGLIAFRGPSRRGIATVSYYQALDASRLLPGDVFRDKTVFIGRSLAASADASSADLFMTPVGPLAGVEIHANVFDHLLRRRHVREPFAATSAYALLLAIVAVAALLVCRRFAPLTAGALLLGAGLLLAVVAYGGRAGELVRLPVLGPLAAAVVVYGTGVGYRYALGARERRYITRAFEHYVAPAVVAEILRDPSKLSLAGEEYDVSIIFTDLEGFTTFSARLSPAEVRAHLSRYLQAMTDLILVEHGTLDRFIGDAVLAYFGCPIREPRHASQACRSALAMERRMRALNAEWRAAGLPELRMRIGVNSGRVVAGNMGTDTVFHYTIIGDAVNVASRLESVNKIYGSSLLVGEQTWERIQGEFAGREIDRIRVAGRDQPLTIYEIVDSEFDSPDAVRAREHYGAGLAAYRQRDWGRAQEAFRAALDARAADGPSRSMLERAGRFESAPAPETWDGVFDLVTK